MPVSRCLSWLESPSVLAGKCGVPLNCPGSSPFSTDIEPIFLFVPRDMRPDHLHLPQVTRVLWWASSALAGVSAVNAYASTARGAVGGSGAKARPLGPPNE